MDYDTVVELNRQYGGDGAGVADESGIRANLGRPESGFEGAEVFPSVWEKAAALLHSFATTQYFSDGSKRTGFIAATTFLELNGYEIADFAAVQSEAFVLSVAANLLEFPKIAEWFEVAHEQRRRGPAKDPRIEFLVLAKEARVGSNGELHMMSGGLAALHVFDDMTGEGDWPLEVTLTVCARIHWRDDEIGRPHRFRARVIQADVTDEEIVMPWTNLQIDAVRGGHPHHPDGKMPTIIALPISPKLPAEGRYFIECEIDGALIGTLRLGLSA